MKTAAHSGGFPSAATPRPRGSRTRRITACLVTFLIFLGLESSFPLIKYRVFPWLETRHTYVYDRDPDAPFRWDSLTATETFEFHPCDGGFECAKLKLPLDYFNGTYPDEYISLAITKLPARVSIHDPRYGGPILLNPGGPGGPGALFNFMEGAFLQTIVDSGVDPDSEAQPDDFMNTEKYFDIIGFDPRGIGWTEPRVYCMPDNPSYWSWKLRELTEGILGSSDAALGRLWSMNHAYGTACKQIMDDEDGPNIKQYMSTASVARDMLEIVERHAEYVSEQIADMDARRPRCKRSEPVDQQVEVPKLQYWGFSYGTYLGSTFASMFPDRVGRMILDGVVSSEDYNTGLGNGSLHDIEKAMSSFYTFCVLSGPELCPLATSNSSIEDVEIRVQSIIQSLYHHPLQVSSVHGPDILTYSDIKLGLFSAVYQPMLAFPIVVQFLLAIEAGGGPIIDESVALARPAHVYTCPVNGTDPELEKSMSEIATVAILCSDSNDLTSTTIREFEDYLDLLVGISPTAGGIWAALRMKCASWKIKAVHRFGNDFGAKTSHPILFLSNTADPVTPLRSGRFMSGKFPGSSLLIQDSAGHCTVSTPCPCTLLHIRSYFQTGAVPPTNTLCTPPSTAFSLNSTNPESPFYDSDLVKSISHSSLPGVIPDVHLYVETEEGRQMMEAAEGLQRAAAERRYFGSGNSGRVNNVMARWLA